MTRKTLWFLINEIMVWIYINITQIKAIVKYEHTMRDDTINNSCES